MEKATETGLLKIDRLASAKYKVNVPTITELLF